MAIDRVDSYKTSKVSAPSNMFHPVDFVIPTGPIFNYTSGMLHFIFHLLEKSSQCIEIEMLLKDCFK